MRSQLFPSFQCRKQSRRWRAAQRRPKQGLNEGEDARHQPSSILDLPCGHVLLLNWLFHVSLLCFFFTLFQCLCLCLLDSGAIEEYYRIPSCSVLSYLIVLLRLYASPGAIFTTILIFLQLVWRKKKKLSLFWNMEVWEGRREIQLLKWGSYRQSLPRDT